MFPVILCHQKFLLQSVNPVINLFHTLLYLIISFIIIRRKNIQHIQFLAEIPLLTLQRAYSFPDVPDLLPALLS